MSVWQGLEVFNNQLHAAWKGEIGDDRLFYSGFNGSTWNNQTTMPANSSVGPALAAFNGKLYAAWKGENGDNRVFYSRFDGSSWDNQATIPANSSVGPALAAFNGKLYAAWKGEEADQRLFYASFDGTNWSAQAQIPGVESSIGPSVAVFEGKLYAAWKGSSNDQRLWYAVFDGSTWSSQAQIPGVESSVGPSLAAFGNKLYAAWKGDSSDQRLWLASFSGTSWSSQTQIPSPVASSIGPSLAALNGQLYAMWVGAGNDQRLWYAAFDGTVWSAQQTLPGNSGQDRPNNIGLKMQYQESSDWCWIAVAVSISHFYDPNSTATQCSTLTPLVDGGKVACCPSAAALTNNPNVAAILASPYTASAYAVLNSNPSLGVPTACLTKTGGVGDALHVNGNAVESGGVWEVNPPLSLEQITQEITAGRPIAQDIAWPNGGSHSVAIAGVLNDLLLICDPIYGETVIQYEAFPAAYQGGATLSAVCLTKKA